MPNIISVINVYCSSCTMVLKSAICDLNNILSILNKFFRSLMFLLIFSSLTSAKATVVSLPVTGELWGCLGKYDVLGSDF